MLCRLECSRRRILMFTLVILLGNEWSGGRDYVLIDSHERAARLIVLGLVPLIMTVSSNHRHSPTGFYGIRRPVRRR